MRLTVGAGVVLVLLALAIAVLVASFAPRGATTVVAPPEPASTAEVESGAVILVHVLGAVTTPGLFELAEGSRTVDAIAAAGGFLDTADQTQLNLARIVGDGEQLYVPAIGEAPPISAPGASTAEGGKVNLNTADAAALDTLPRVGPTTAAHIIEWREANGRFNSIEDLMSVTGIGEKTFDGLKDLVTV